LRQQFSDQSLICVKCKKIRADKGYWNKIESYIREHSVADFRHGICPECAKKNLALITLMMMGRKTRVAKSLIKFQKILNIPAVQLVNKSGICKLVSNNNLKIMIISADHWLSLLP
jgi:hypothetical protein